MLIKKLIEPNITIENICSIFDSVIDSTDDSICVVDKKGKVVVWNERAEQNYKINKNEILGKYLVDFFPSALLPKVMESEREYKNIYNSPREGVYNIISARPLYENNELVGAVSCDKDISDVIELSHILEHTKENLEEIEKKELGITATESVFKAIIGEDNQVKEAIQLCKSIAGFNISVLITGDSGTGKEVFARAIHDESKRKGLFVPINCSAIPNDLIESELFGYEEGAFTGAKQSGTNGKFEIADGGTLFLDEIGDMPLIMQAKLLRVIEDGIVTKIGSTTGKKVDVRIIAATNKDVAELITSNQFRKDLYYRLNSIQIKLPTLNDRRKDIPLLVEKFIKEFSLKYGKVAPDLSHEMMNYLRNYNWEGNIRELKNLIERIVIIADDMGKICEERIMESTGEVSGLSQESLHESLLFYHGKDESLKLENILEAVEKKVINEALSKSMGNKTKASKLLGIPRSTLYFKMEKYKIEES